MNTPSQDSSRRIQRLLWITDPWSTLSHSNDTTLRLMQEALKLGIPTYWSSSDFILNTPSLTTILVSEVKDLSLDLDHEPKHRIELEASNFHQLHYRLDPPVDFNYISLLDGLAARGQGSALPIYSTPHTIKTQSEKLPPKELAHITPQGCVVRDARDVALAFDLLKDEKKVVTKPLNLAQSIGVASWDAGNTLKEWEMHFLQATLAFSQPLLVQEYLPGINDGEVRMWFANGEFVAALKKFPKSGDFRVLIDEGSKVAAYQLDEQELKHASEVGAILKTQGVMLAAIDFISGKISDYNITSPGLLVQLEQVHGGKNFAKIILEKIL